LLYSNQTPPQSPVSDATPTKQERNAEIRQRHAEGELVSDLAKEFGISVQRIHQILKGKRK
jgi:Mor family transcriptional regulator